MNNSILSGRGLAAAGSLQPSQPWLMSYDPATGQERPYPSEANQWRDWHGHATAWLFNPWTGERRDARDVGHDVNGKLINVTFPLPSRG